MSEVLNLKDLDLQIRVRSAKMSIADLIKITTVIVETLKESSKLNLVEQNTIVNQTSEKKLITITSNFQTEE